MEEARRVLARLDRIEALDRAGAPPPALLHELRGLLVDAEAWLGAEARAGSGATGGAGDVLERCRAALGAEGAMAMA